MNEFTSTFDRLIKMPDDAPAADIAAIVSAPVEPVAPVAPDPAAAAPAGEAPAAPVEGEVPGIVEPPKPGETLADPNAAAPVVPDPKAPPAAPEVKPAAPDKDAALLETLRTIAENSKPKEVAPVAPAAEQPPEMYTVEQQKIIKDYLEEYPEIAGAERLIRQQEHVEMAQYMFEQIAPQMAWMRDMVLTLAGNMHHGELRTMIPTYETDRDKMIAWVEEQPSFLQKGMKEVIDGGTAEEVRELFQHYSKATGVSLTPPAPASAPPPKVVTELPDPVKQAAGNLAPVGSSRSTPAMPDDPNDYKGAFRRAIDEVK